MIDRPSAEKGAANTPLTLDPRETLLGRVDPAVPVTHLDRRGKYSFAALQRLRDLVNREHQTVVAVNLYPLLYVIPVVKWRRLSNVKAVGLINTDDLVGRAKLFGNLYAHFLKQCDQIVFGCSAQRTHWVKRYDLPMPRSRVIYNGVDYDFYSPTSGANEAIRLRQQLGIPADTIVIGSIGRLAPEKSYDSLISALARLNAAGRETYAIFAGKGAEWERLERLATAQGLGKHVNFLGVQSDVRPIISAMDIFVLPSKAVETFSNAALEAMAMARPVVLSEMGGAAEMVENGKTGFLFPVGEIDALVDILSKLHDSQDMRERLGMAARERVVNSFGFLGMVDQYRELMSPD